MEIEVRSCFSHGSFRGDACPECGEKGKVLLYPDEVEGLGKVLAGMLRHFPERYGIRLTPNGYAKIYSIIPAIKAQRHRYGFITPLHIEALCSTDERGRYELNERGEIRATYGHTIPIDLSDLPTDDIPKTAYYQTTDEEFSILKETGIFPSDKTYIHLSDNYRKAFISGLFHVDDPKIIGINCEAMSMEEPIYKASREVLLTKQILPNFIFDLPKEDVKPTEEENSEIKSYREKRERKLMGERSS